MDHLRKTICFVSAPSYAPCTNYSKIPIVLQKIIKLNKYINLNRYKNGYKTSFTIGVIAMVSLKCQQLLVQFYNNLYPINYGLATTKPVFCNRLVVILSWNPLDLATSFGFNDPDPSDGGWSQNPM